jgi:fatty-acyl-CoA synthase
MAERAVEKRGSCGLPLIGTELAVLDEERRPVAATVHGELAVRSSGRILGYLRDPEATAATFVDTWTLTGDIAYRDEDGFVFIVDRKKDMIISGGLNIYSAELENALSTHPGVRQCASVAAPHPTWGETPWMFVVPSETPATEEELIAHLRTKLGTYKTPTRVVMVQQLPLGPTGKILKRALRERVTAELAADAGRT